MTDEHHTRRSEDRDREINHRLDSLDRCHRELSTQVASLDAQMNLLKVEQGHMTNLFGARFSVLEKTQELQTAKIDQIGTMIRDMASEAEKSPAGRSIIAQIQTVEDVVAANGRSIENINAWRQNVDGALFLLKYIFGPGSILALTLVILRMAGVIR